MELSYLLDTDTCIYIAKHDPPVARARLSQLKPGEVGMSIITFGELMFGAEKSTVRPKALAVLAALRKQIPVLPLDPEAASRYAQLRAALERAGKPIGGNDLWIAAHALCLGVTLVTNNLREFRRVRNLKLENWAK